MSTKYNSRQDVDIGIKGFEPLNIRTKNEGLTNLAIFQIKNIDNK